MLKEKLNKLSEKNDCTAAVIINKDKVLLGNRIYPEKNLSVWNFPGGRCDQGETIEKTLRREVLEEIGIDGKDLEIIDFIGKIKGSWKDDMVYLFLCSIKKEPILMEPEKFKEWKWVEIEKGLDLHFNKKIIKAISNYLNKNKHKE